MIFLDLFLGFLKVGCFAFGGAYGAIPLIRDVVMSYGWMGEEEFAYMIAVSESTPGPIMVNMATYVGSSQAGLLGAAAATLAVVLPSFVIIILVTALLRTVLANKYVKAALRGMKPCVIGIVLATGLYMAADNCFDNTADICLDMKAVLITAVLACVMLAYKHFAKKKLPPITLIVISAAVGIVVYGVF